MTQYNYNRFNRNIGEDCSDIDLDATGATQQVLARSGLDWPVHLQDGLGDDWIYTGNKPRNTYRWVEEYDEDGTPTGFIRKLHLGQSTDRRKVFQNQDVFDAVVKFCQSNELPILRAGMLNRGVRQFAICGLNESFELKGGDTINAQILILHSHAVGSLTFAILTERPICFNQLVLPPQVKQISLQHTRTFSTEEAIAKLTELQDGVRLFQRQAEYLSDRSIRAADLSADAYKDAQAWIVNNLGDPDKRLYQQPRYVKEMLGGNDDMLAQAVALKTVLRSGSSIRLLEEGSTSEDASLDKLPKAFQEIMDLYYNGPGSELQSAFNTPWGILNAVTHYYNHHSSLRGGIGGHFGSLWQGSKAQTTQYALQQSQAVAALVD